MAQTIHVGYEVGTGKPVAIPADRHIGITGQTQRSGKTTTIEALIARSTGCALAFITKRGEGSFKMPTAQIDPYFRDPMSAPDSQIAPWEFVLAILEAKMRTQLYMHRRFIMQLCEPHAQKTRRAQGDPGQKHKPAPIVLPGWERPKSLGDV